MKTKRTEKECSVLFKKTEKNAKNVPFFLKERKRTNILLKRTDAKPCIFLAKMFIKICQKHTFFFSPLKYSLLLYFVNPVFDPQKYLFYLNAFSKQCQDLSLEGDVRDQHPAD